MSALTIDDPALVDFARAVGDRDRVAVRGAGTRWELGGPLDREVRIVEAPTGIVEHRPDEMTVTVRAGTTVADLHSALASHGQRTALPERGGTVGGAVAAGECGIRRLGDGHVRDALLMIRAVDAAGRLFTAGGPTVKNVSGFDLVRLLVGSLGTLAAIGDVMLRTVPLSVEEAWFVVETAEPSPLADLVTAASVLWDGAIASVLLAGHPDDVAADRERVAGHGPVEATAGPPDLPPRRWSRTPTGALGVHVPGRHVVEVGIGVIHAAVADPDPPVLDPGAAAIAERVRDRFDPDRRLNPGRDPFVR